MIHYLRRIILFTLLLFAGIILSAQNNSGVFCIDVAGISLYREIRPEISTAFIAKDARPELVYSSAVFKPGSGHKGAVPDNYVTKKALVRFTICNTADTIQNIYFFPGFYFRQIKLFRATPSGLQPLPDIMPAHRERAGYRQITLAAHDSMQVVAELQFVKTYLNKIRPRLVNPDYLNAFINTLHNISWESDMPTYVFSGLLLMMILYSLSVYFQGGRNEFLFYSGYAFFIGFMLFTKALYNYHTEPISYFLEEYLDFILQCLGIIFYMIFMQKFLATKQVHRFLHRLYNLGILLLLISIFLYSFLHYFTDNYTAENLTENGTKLLLLVMIIIFMGYSIQHWSIKLFRYLFWGYLLFLLFSLLSLTLIIAPELLPLNGLAANALIYYKAGLFFELVFFLAGLTYKNRRRIIEETKERETLKAQNMLKEYEKEIAVYKAQQEERERISADMHDELGSGMTAIRLMSEIARNKMQGNTPVEIEKISRSADDVLNKMNAIIWSMNSSNDTLEPGRWNILRIHQSTAKSIHQ